MALRGWDGARDDGATSGTVRRRVFWAGGDGASDGSPVPHALNRNEKNASTGFLMYFILKIILT